MSTSDEDEKKEDVVMSESLRLKRFGASEDEMKKWSALQRLGASHSQMELGNSITAENHVSDGATTKVEKVIGFTEEEKRRAKALQTLGTNEEERIESRAKRLGEIGQSTRVGTRHSKKIAHRRQAEHRSMGDEE